MSLISVRIVTLCMSICTILSGDERVHDDCHLDSLSLGISKDLQFAILCASFA